MNKYLIIGSKGFIGTHLVRKLNEQGMNVWGADVVVDYEADDSYFLIDASNADFRPLFESQSFDVCINCSGAANVPESLRVPLRDFNLNAVNVFKLLESIRVLQPSCRFVNLSSAAVYGNPRQLPISEDSPTDPISPYGVHKKASEAFCEEFYRFFKLKTCSLRIFSAYGDGLKKQLFWDLYRKARSQEKVTLFGTGEESRDFIFVEDLVNAILVVAQNSSYEADVVNVANGEQVFLKDCVSIFFEKFDASIEYAFSGEGRSGDPDNWVADISRLKDLGYEQSFSLEQGLDRYCKWIMAVEKESA